MLPLAAGALSQQTRKLNAPLGIGPAGRVTDYRLAPNGLSVVYLADRRLDDFFDLHLAPLDAAVPPRRLNGDAGEVTWFEIAPDGANVVFLADSTADQVIGPLELWSASLAGVGDPVRLNGTLVTNGRVIEARISADSSWVAYRAIQEAARTDVYSVPIDGSAPSVRLNDPSAGVSAFEITLDSSRVAFTSDQLYVAPITGGVPPTVLTSFAGSQRFWPTFLEVATDRAVLLVYTEPVFDESVDAIVTSVSLDAPGAPHLPLSPPMDLDWSEYEVWSRLSPDGSLIAYIRPDGSDLYVAPVDGSHAFARVNAASQSALEGAEFTPDSSRIVFRIDALGGNLFSATTGVTPVAVQLGSGSHLASSFVIRPDGAAVSFVAGSVVSGHFDLFRIPIGGGTTVKVNGSMSVTRTVLDGARYAPGDRLVFVADKQVDDRFDVYIAPDDASAPPTRISGPLPAGRDVSSVLAGASRAMFHANIEWDDAFGLHSVPFDGSPPQLMVSTSPLSVSGDVDADWVFAPNGRFAVYEAEHAPFGVNGVGRADLRSGAPTEVLEVAADITQLAVTPDSTRVLYLAGTGVSGTPELYGVPASFGTPPIRLSGALSWGASGVSGLRIAPDSSRAVYIAEEFGTGYGLYSIPVDGSAGRVQLTQFLNGRGSVREHRIAPDSSRVVYRSDPDTQNAIELYSIPITGGPRVKLHAPFTSYITDVGGDFATLNSQPTFQLTADSEHAVFLADRDVNDAYELYVSPVDGSATELELSAPLVAGGVVLAFRISPDSSRVAYVADQDVDERRELYSVGIAGGTPVKLSPPSSDSTDVSLTEVWISPDSTQVVFLVEHATDADHYWRAPIDGSAPAVLLTGLPGSSATGGVISADSAWFVYRAADDLYSIPLLGGETRRLNSRPHSAVAVLTHSLSPDGSRVAYVADQVEDGVNEAFTVPIDGSAAPRRQNQALVPDGDVAQCGFTPDSRSVVWWGDQEEDEVYELFLRYQGRLASQATQR